MISSSILRSHAEAAEGQGKKPKAAPRFSAEDKQLAVNVHRVHLLCLLARALAMDQAASDPVVQVTSPLLLLFFLACLLSAWHPSRVASDCRLFCFISGRSMLVSGRAFHASWGFVTFVT